MKKYNNFLREKYKKNYIKSSSLKFLNNLTSQIIYYYRIKFYNIFKEKVNYKKNSTILDIGTTPVLNNFENILLHLYPWKNKITCFSNQNCSVLKKYFNGIKIIQGDARVKRINKKYDIVFSNATIEHVGNTQSQIRFLKNLNHLSKKFIFVVTPNRFFPIEFHTKLILINLLPTLIFRKILKFFGDNFFSLEENLNLLSYKRLSYICSRANIKKFNIIRFKIFFFTSHLILFVKKN